ncbi:MAG: WecB/TagA/CpsF family glycosyltransferase [Erysipelotrichaceae bacterium]
MQDLFKKLYREDALTFQNTLKKNLQENKKMFVVTANPETFMIGEEEAEFKKCLLDENTTLVPDGIGIVKATHYLNCDVKQRIPGIEIAEALLKMGNEMKKSIYLFGSKEHIIDDMREVIQNNYPMLDVVGYQNGYVDNRDAVFLDILEKQPDIILVALGIPTQEKLIYRHFSQFKKGIFVGVGGSFDVLSGNKKRAPSFFIRFNIEWLYRISKEPKRFKRFYKNNMKFLLGIRKLKRENPND